MNKYRPHVYVIPEDDADRQLAEGFVDHHSVDERWIKVMPGAGGWPNVLTTFEDEYIPNLRKYPVSHVVMLIDFDDDVQGRRTRFQKAIPVDVKPRVFVIGAKNDPETIKKALGKSLMEVGRSLAADCDGDTWQNWHHEQLKHNDSERLQLVQTVRPILFDAPADPEI